MKLLNLLSFVRFSTTVKCFNFFCCFSKEMANSENDNLHENVYKKADLSATVFSESDCDEIFANVNPKYDSVNYVICFISEKADDNSSVLIKSKHCDVDF